jgi:hypothetical protein
MKNLFISLVVFINVYCFSGAQGQNIDWNLVITIDEKVIYENIDDMKLRIKGINEVGSIKATYVPGSLKLLELNNQLNTIEDSLFLSFTHFVYEKSNLFEYEYEIYLSKEWFNYSFMVISIYNLDNKKYRRRYKSHKNKPFVYDLYSSKFTRLTMH